MGDAADTASLMDRPQHKLQHSMGWVLTVVGDGPQCCLESIRRAMASLKNPTDTRAPAVCYSVLKEHCMTEAKVVWTDNERFIGAASSGHAMVVDAGPTKTASGPMELVLIGLCACTAVDVVNILKKKREPFMGLEVHAEAERASEPPKVYTNIKLVYTVKGNVAEKAMEDAVRLSEEKYCSVAGMLKSTAKIEYEIRYDRA